MCLFLLSAYVFFFDLLYEYSPFRSYFMQNIRKKERKRDFLKEKSAGLLFSLYLCNRKLQTIIRQEESINLLIKKISSKRMIKE